MPELDPVDQVIADRARAIAQHLNVAASTINRDRGTPHAVVQALLRAAAEAAEGLADAIEADQA